MQLKTKNMRFMNKLRLFVFILFMFSVSVFSQDVNQIDASVSKLKKIDGIAGVVGDYIILDSDVQRTYEQLKSDDRISQEEITPCGVLEKLLEERLYAHHAVQDSIPVSDAEIRQNVENQIQQFLQQTGGSMEKLVEFYGEENEKSFRNEIFEINKVNLLASRMRTKVIENEEITPDEVRLFYDKIPEDEKPVFGAELKIAQIIIEPKVSKEEEQRVIDKLNQFRTDIIEHGASFASKAVLYSEDPGSSGKGGRYTLNRKQPKMVKEFRQIAFSLEEGEISKPFKTDFGYHIVTLEKIRGQEYDVAHILLTPKVSDDALKEARDRMEKVRARIIEGNISFSDAAREASDEKQTKYDGGQLINPITQDYNFELTRMDPQLYTQIQNLKNDEVSLIFKEQDRQGNVKFKIVMITDRVDEHKADYSKDYLKIKKLALEQKRIKTITLWQKEKIRDTYVKIDDEKGSCNFSNNWLKI